MLYTHFLFFFFWSVERPKSRTVGRLKIKKLRKDGESWDILLCKQFCNFARGRYHLANENTWPSTLRKRTTKYYFTLHCYRFVNAPLIRDENERKINPTPKLAFPFPPIQKPSPYLRAYQRAISIQNEPIIARKIQRCSLLCSWVLFIDSNSLL